ncbi:FprA family A-type flavoprotein [Candidatus Bathyarchaeota archaeon]|nr:MAG: FprA family A-type flavoprotein [Candidatus Bathyarchaeota archaeon]RLI22235.1 MAG: FprA family A-type flavoprotein [Candidatus Bathyarchaeota archaeon]
MKPRKLVNRVYWVGAVDWDRRLFDELIPLPDGTSYNAYLIKGSEKTALIDTVDPTMTDVLVKNLKLLDVEDIDYVVTNHAEQDHSGALPEILKLYPKAKVISTRKCKELLVNLLLIPEDKIITVEDRETLALGDKTLEFIHLPWVHWPETMVTYLREDGILFPCDLFGSHFASSDLYVTDEAMIYEAAKRYYAEIMMPFRTIIERNLKKLQGLDLKVIAPSHGPVYNRPDFITEAYREWVYSPPKNVVVLPYVSMHGSTKVMVDYFVSALVDRGVAVKQFNLTKTDIGKLAMALVDAATIVVGSPTVLGGPHPNVVYAVYLTNALRPKLKFASIIGSYGWGGRTVDVIAGMLSNLRVELLEPVLVRGLPKTEDFKRLDRLADEISNKHRDLGLS